MWLKTETKPAAEDVEPESGSDNSPGPLPENKEIASYIRRTEAEISKIKELSYEP